MIVSDLEKRILLACAGEIVSLPYNAEQAAASRSLEVRGLIACGYDDDQPTAWVTDAGRAALAST